MGFALGVFGLTRPVGACHHAPPTTGPAGAGLCGAPMSRRGWGLFLAMGVIWGIPYLLIKVAVEDLPPASLVLARTSLAGLLLVPVAAGRGLLRPLVPYWRPML